jgi:hypothetical protein
VQVTFIRTGERSYAIAARRGRGDALHMPRAPGYDPWLPHLVAELDEVATRWHALSVGEALTLTWPAQLTIRPGGSSRGRRRNRDRRVAARRR